MHVIKAQMISNLNRVISASYQMRNEGEFGKDRIKCQKLSLP